MRMEKHPTVVGLIKGMLLQLLLLSFIYIYIFIITFFPLYSILTVAVWWVWQCSAIQANKSSQVASGTYVLVYMCRIYQCVCLCLLPQSGLNEYCVLLWHSIQ